MKLSIMILIGIASVAFGVYLGMPGRADAGGPLAGRWGRRPDDRRVGEHSEKHLWELERALGSDLGQTKKARRHFTILGWMRKDTRASHRRRSVRRFRTAAPSRRGRIGRR